MVGGLRSAAEYSAGQRTAAGRARPLSAGSFCRHPAPRAWRSPAKDMQVEPEMARRDADGRDADRRRRVEMVEV